MTGHGNINEKLRLNKLPLLDDWNMSIQADATTQEHLLAGVRCPDCYDNGIDVEMVFVEPAQILTSNPPQKYVRCPYCQRTGYKVI